MIEKGDSLPDFELENQHGEIVKSENIENAIIYFYPKADTPGCTKEACGFRDSIEALDRESLEVYGISTDNVEEQKKFAEKYGLNFDLLADKEGGVTKKFGVITDSGHAERTTFVIENGEVDKVFRKVDPEGHVEEVLEYLEN